MKKGRIIRDRILQLIPVLIIVTILAFWLSQVSAGDIAAITLQSQGITPTEESLAAVREELGLNAPIAVQYMNWLSKAVRFDFGVSFQTHHPVAEEILSRFPATLKLAISASILSVLIAVPVALISVRYRNKLPDQMIRIVSSVGATFPEFCIGLLLLYYFGVKWKLAPVVSGSQMKNIWLPALSLALQFASTYIRVLRENLIEVRNLDFMKAARARGLSETAALLQHGLSNAIMPVITLLGINFGKLVAGSVAIETIFSWNGIGQFAIASMKMKDLPVIQGYIMIVLLSYVVVNLVLDIIFMCIDPRISVG